MHASKHFDPQVGIDIHLYVFPPIPAPIPLPTPNLSLVFDPFDYIPFIGGTVHINGVKRTTAGSGALAVHIPLGPWVPPHGAPMGPTVMDTEVFMGSMTVVADGDPLSRITMPALDCNIVGLIFPFRLRKPKKPHLNLALPTSLNLAIPNTVIVGGPPMISIASMLFKGAFAGLGALRRTKAFGRGMDAFKGVRQRAFKNMDSGFLKCKVLRAEPVDVRDGSVSIRNEDFAIPGRLPLAWSRRYRSNDPHVGVLGQGWHTPADTRLEVFADGVALFHAPDGGVAVFPTLPTSDGKDGAVLELVDGAKLLRLPHDPALHAEALDASAFPHGALEVRTKDGVRYRFAAPALAVLAASTTPTPSARAANDDGPALVLAIERLGDAFDNHWTFERRDGALVRVQESGIDGLAGRFLEVGMRAGRLVHVALHDPDEGKTYPLVRYGYEGSGNGLDAAAGANVSAGTQLTAAYDALDNPRRYAYRDGRLIRHTDRNGLSFHYEYDAQWRVVHSWGDGGLYDYRFAWHDQLDETEITDSLGHVTSIKFDDHRLPLCEIDPLGGCTFFEYDEVGRTVAVIDPANRRTAFDYDARGNLLRLTRPDGSTLATTYDADGRAVAVTDPSQASWTQAWDARGLLTRQVTPLGATSTYAYDGRGQLLAHTDARGAATSLAYDRHGQVRSVTDPLGAVGVFRSDACGRLLEQGDAAGASTRYAYDAKGRLTSVVRPAGATVRAVYDAEDQLLRYVDEAGQATTLDYVGIGRVARRLPPDGHAVRYEYDTEEQLIAVVNQRGERYRLARDALGRIVEETDYWGQVRQYRYDAAGRLTRSVDPLGRGIAYATDALGRITGKTLPDPDHPGRQLKEHFEYDPRGQLVGLRNDHRRITRRFDRDGRLVEEVQDGFAITSTYDAGGLRTGRRTSAGNTLACTYDLRGQLTALAINDEAPITIERDALGRAVTEQLSPHLRRQLRYDDHGRLTAQAVRRDEAPLFETTYAYDAVGNLTTRHDSEQGRDAYTYDPLGRVLAHTDPAGTLTRFLHDPAGDRLRTRALARPQQQVAGGAPVADDWTREGDCEGQRYVFDRAGNLVRRGGADGGHSTGAGSSDLSLRWDANQRLVESVRAGVTTRYGYDPLGRRVFKRGPTQTTRFYWDGDALLGEVTHASDAGDAVSDDEGRIVDFAAARRRRDALLQLHKRAREYVYYPGSFVPMALIDKRAPASRSRPAMAPSTTTVIDTPPSTGAAFERGDYLGPVSAHRQADPSSAKRTGLGGIRLGQAAATRTAAASRSPQEQPAHEPPLGVLGAFGQTGLVGTTPSKRISSTDELRADIALTVSPRPLSPSKAEFESGATNNPPQTSADITGVYHFHFDPNGCPTRLTDARGAVVWSARFAVWGRVAELHTAAIDNSLRFQGQYFDVETGLHYNRYRHYDPTSGQFISQDPLGLGAGPNVYAYAPNPAGWTDPLGLKPKTRKELLDSVDGRLADPNTKPDALWRVYQQSSQSPNELVIGRLPDTEAGESLGMRRLADPDWTLDVNDAWMQGGIDSNRSFYLGSNPVMSNFRSGNPRYPTTVFLREMRQLRAAGYTRRGDNMVPPGPCRT